ncbi:MAG: hypothetical protein ACRDJX_01925 [Solirubrobacteraceae bacterium]
MERVEYVPEREYRLKLRRAKEHLDTIYREIGLCIKNGLGAPVRTRPQARRWA